MRSSRAAVSALVYAAGTSAATARFCPDSSSDACFSWGVPESAASSSSGSGNVYIQMTAPSSYAWAGLGIGSRMAGADMFLMYKDGAGNVTLSTRSGSGHVEPEFEQRGQVELLAGSGVEGDTMTANFRCGDCSSLDLSGSSGWIAAWRSSGSLESASASAGISFHSDHFQFDVDLSQASISSDANPYTETSRDSNSNPSPGADSDSNAGSDGGSGGAVTGTSGPSNSMLLAHGIVMTVAFAFLYPLGALLMPLVGQWLVHGSVQITAFLAMWAGFALGYRYARDENTFFNDSHTKLGTIVVALLGIQPVLGWLHHVQFKRKGRRTMLSHVHVWYGRVLMIVGIINGGIGLRLQGGERTFKIVYAVVAGVFGGMYIGAAIWGGIQRRRAASSRIKQTKSPMSQQS